MKARKEDDGQIKFYGEIPSKWLGVTGNYAGGFHLVDEETLQKEGFYDVVEPEYNRVLETLSPIYLNEEKKVYTYDVISKPDLPTIDEAKKQKIDELKRRAKDKFNETDWYYTRELRMKDLGIIKPVPDEIIKQTEDLYNLLDKKEKEINKLSDLELVLTYDTGVEVEIKEIIETEVAKEESASEQVVSPEQTEDVVEPQDTSTPSENIPEPNPSEEVVVAEVSPSPESIPADVVGEIPSTEVPKEEIPEPEVPKNENPQA